MELDQPNFFVTYENREASLTVLDDDSVAHEINAIQSLKRKLPANIPVTFRQCSLNDAVDFICTAPLEERKPLLLYLHNSELPFSQMLIQNLGSSDLGRILNRTFFVLGWDLENTAYHDALRSALRRHLDLQCLSDLVTHKVAVAVVILPVDGVLTVFLALRDNISIGDTIKSLKEAESVFKLEIKNEIKLLELEREKSHKDDLGSEKLQAIWADMLGDRDYDSFEFGQDELLEKKIGFGLKGPPQKESGYDTDTQKQITKLKKCIKTESNKIAKFKDHIEIAVIFNCLEPLPEEKIKRAKKFKDYNPQTDVNPVPVFILRKCRDSKNPCRVFIDDTGRVYQNWKEYLTRNKLPKCEMVIPLNGRYQVINDNVLLERHLSPACHIDAKLLQVGDIVTAAAGISSGVVLLTGTIAALPVVAAPVMIGAVVAGTVAGVWAIGRSSYTIYDRIRHKESMSFAESEARGAYLNIVAGSLGFVGAGANMALTQLASRGVNIGRGFTYFTNTVGVLNITASGVGVANSGYDVFDQWFNKNQKPSALTILQLSSSVFFFGHAIYSFKGARTVVDETQARTLSDYQDSLRSNRHRKTFTKLLKETMKTSGDETRGRAEVISAIRNIPNKNEVFAALTRNNKAMNKAGVKFSADNGQISLNGIKVDMNEFMSLNTKQTKRFLVNLAQDSSNSASSVPNTSNNPTLNSTISKSLSYFKIDISKVNINQLATLTSKIINFCSADIQTKVIIVVNEVIKYFMNTDQYSEIAGNIDKYIPKDSTLYMKVLDIAISYFSSVVNEWELRYQNYQKTGDKKYYHPLFDYVNPLYAKRTVNFFEFLVKNCYSGHTLCTAVLEKITFCFAAWVMQKIDDYNKEKAEKEKLKAHSANFRPKQITCAACGGYYFNHLT